MRFHGFTEEDFDVFSIEGLEPRMEAIKETVRPKLEDLGDHFAAWFTNKTGEEMFPHVAKHARRKVNPPDDTWVAVAHSKRGYKKLPHFQIGLFGSHVFVWFAVIYESPVKGTFARLLKEQKEELISHIPTDFVWSADHTKPEAVAQSNLSDEDFAALLDRLETVKKAELLCGKHFSRTDPVLADKDQFLRKVEQTFETVLPLYRIARQAEEK
ncbi:hypothetical protein CR205_04405 [Alteribacter lacisalsi]|uniref:UPF0637 protein CR205_04405 n=1 Tax=Alteribacter lacisalsi TaxID=2045244 RepID=A0A2W0HAB1_9BACI|nr:DUF1054 domain-containing protein [Alteribacter lacisalsi]PYZ97841.1 hypothetical protein CR205_04405 [Alteribacter lacisalsi]